MNFARLIVLGVAIVFAGMAAYLVRSISTSQGPAVAALEAQVAAIETSAVLVATRSITVGETMTANDFRWQTWPEDAVHLSFITRTNSQTAPADWTGAVLRSPVVEGEPLTAHKMVRIGEGGVMAAIIEPGKRGVGLKISAHSGAGGFILPNDRVDAVVTYKKRDQETRTDTFVSETIIKNVRVLAIDQTFREEDGQQVVVGRTATLELSALQTEDLAMATEMGEVTLALRSLASQNLDESEELLEKTRKRGNKQVAVIRNGRMSGSR